MTRFDRPRKHTPQTACKNTHHCCVKKQATKKTLHPKIYPKITESTDFSASCKRWNVANNHALGSIYTSTYTKNKYCLLRDSFKSLYQIYSLNMILHHLYIPLYKALLRLGYFPKETPISSDPNASLTSFGSRPPVFQKTTRVFETMTDGIDQNWVEQ